jgi:hypothetical protein
MKRTPVALIVTAALASLSGFARAEDPSPPPPSAQFMQRTDARFGDFAGSSANLTSLTTGLRSGTPFTLTGSGETVTVATPTRPMGYGNITRSLDLASRELAAQGITDPTPKEIQAALTGGTVNGANGPVTLQGVLTLRNSGMGWGQIAHTVGVFPGMGAPAQARFATTAPGSSMSGITTAAGTTAGASASQGQAHGHAAAAAGVTSAGGGAASAGNSAGKGQGNAFGRGK